MRKAGSESSEVLKGVVCVSSSHLPSHSDVHVSCLTGERVQVGSCYIYEPQSEKTGLLASRPVLTLSSLYSSLRKLED